MALSGTRFEQDPDKAGALFYFEDTTVGALPLGYTQALLNGACLDISKSHVAAIFEEIFGYALSVDPMTHTGLSVQKSERNGVHDGQIVTCPMPPQPGMTYQKFVDCSRDGVVFDYRTTIIGRAPRFVLVKTKAAADRFSMHNTSVRFSQLTDIFSDDEISAVSRFCERMGLDWAALDILRDAATQKIYIVDVNKTDTGPAVDLSWRDRSTVTRHLVTGFVDLVAARHAQTKEQLGPPAPEAIEDGENPEPDNVVALVIFAGPAGLDAAG